MELFYILFVLLVVTKLFGELALRLGQPALLGELVSGVALGLLVQRFSGSFPILSGLTENEVFVAVADLGVFFLMLLAGLEMSPKELTESSQSAVVVALCAMLLPLGTGMAVAWWFLPKSDYRFAQALFVGVALAITAVPVVIKVLRDLGKLNSPVGKTVVSAAFFDDVLSLVLLAFLTAIVRTGELPSLAGVALLLLKILVFFLVTGAIGAFLLPLAGRYARKLHAEELEMSFLLIVAFALAVFAEVMQMHFIIGAFVAGLIFRKQTIDREAYHQVQRQVSGLTTGFLAPLFFASIGLHLDLAAATAIPGLLCLLITVAIVTKFLGAFVPASVLGLSYRDSAAAGIAMSARGAVELVIADIAFRAGLFNQPTPPPPEVEYLFSAIVIVAIVTTVMVPVALQCLLKR